MSSFSHPCVNDRIAAVTYMHEILPIRRLTLSNQSINDDRILNRLVSVRSVFIWTSINSSLWNHDMEKYFFYLQFSMKCSNNSTDKIYICDNINPYGILLKTNSISSWIYCCKNHWAILKSIKLWLSMEKLFICYLNKG